MKTVSTKVLENRQISPDFYQLKFVWKEEWGIPQIGNFLELKVSESTAPLLRRPFAFSNYSNEVGEIIYQLRGESTKLLSKKQNGDEVDIIAPIGNSFTYENTTKTVFAIAGGVGVGPILFAAKKAKEEGKKVVFITGYRNSELVPDTSIFDGVETVICTDDGSMGFGGNVVDYLKTVDKKEFENSIIWSCGPIPMLKGIHTFSQEKNITALVSMEEMMACGIGACMGCVIETNDTRGMARVCKDGPIFESDIVKWK